MTTRGREEGCRVCGGALHGNQRRWLFGGPNKRQTLSSVDSIGQGSQTRSAQSSPWGSTLSLGSSLSLSKTRSLSSPSKGVDLLAVLTHTLGQSVPRGNRRGEFLCGKCVSVLERVFKFDTVIARVKILSAQRLQNLCQERDKIQQWVCGVYRQRNPEDWGGGVSPSEEENEEGVGKEPGTGGESYREMLRENMALSEFECWSEKWKSCPYFQRTGKKCKKGKNCEGCDSLRVSDSAYESVCGVPRHLPFQPLSPLALSRDKSRSMPLHWSRRPSLSSCSESLTGSCLSLRGVSHFHSVQSLDSLDGYNPLNSPGELLVNLGDVLREIKGIEARPVSSPTGSRIPVRDRRGSRTGIVRVLSFGEEDGHEDNVDEEIKDVLNDLNDEFIPLHRGNTTGQTQNVIRQLKGQLAQAFARIRTLEAELKSVTKDDASQSRFLAMSLPMGSENVLIQTLGDTLHSREMVIQDCMAWTRKLCLGVGAGNDVGDKLLEKLTGALKKMHKDSERVLESRLSELREREQVMESEMEALRQNVKEKERDLNVLSTVLQCNQDVISELRVELGECERVQTLSQREMEAWRERDQAMAALLREKEAFSHCLKEALESTQKDVQALSDSVIGYGVSGGGTDGALAYQLRQKDTLLYGWLKDKEEHEASLRQEVAKLSTTLKDLQTMVQVQRDSRSQTVSTLSAQLRETQTELREKEQQSRETKGAWQSERAEQRREERKLREKLEKRDQLIQQVLLDSEERDRLLAELQQTLVTKLEHQTALRNTL